MNSGAPIMETIAPAGISPMLLASNVLDMVSVSNNSMLDNRAELGATNLWSAVFIDNLDKCGETSPTKPIVP